MSTVFSPPPRRRGTRSLSPAHSASGLALALSVLALAACGSESTAPASPAKAGSAVATSVAASPRGASCGGVVGLVRDKVSGPTVTDVTVTGACTIVTVTTNLSNDQLTDAVNLCDAAGPTAYKTGTTSVTIVGASGKELAVGLSTAPCIGEP